MGLLVPTAAELDFLGDAISPLLATWHCRLFITNLMLASTTTLADLLAAEASFGGYAPVALPTWSAPVLGGSGDAETSTTNATWTPTSGGGTGDLYGYFYTNSAGTKFYGCQSFSPGPLSSAVGIAFNLDLTYTVLSQA
jgi:hypothetical protein